MPVSSPPTFKGGANNIALGTAGAVLISNGAGAAPTFGGTNTITAAEIGAGITPTNFSYMPGWATRFGVDVTGASDASAALQNALNAAASGAWFQANGGATVVIPSGAKLQILSNITIPNNVTLIGPQSFVGTMTANSQNANYAALGGSIALASTATITMDAGACIDGLLIYRQGMTFPATDSSAFAGTAITVAGDDVCIKSSMILGFNQAVSSNGYQRLKCFDLLMDNVNGIYVNNSQDTLHFSRCHCWPFAVFRTGLTAAQQQRSGTAYSINNSNDWGKIHDCFSFGYNTGFFVNTCNSLDFVQCGADSTGAYGSGFATQGVCYDIEFGQCQSSGQSQGWSLAHLFDSVNNKRTSVRLNGCVSWGDGTHGILINSTCTGDTQIRGGEIRNVPNGISYAVTAGTAILDVDLVRFDSDVTVPFNISVSTTNVNIGNSNDFGAIAAGTQLIGTPANVGVASIASQAQINIPETGDTFIVTGTNGISTAVFGWAGREVTLIFSGILTITSATGAYNDIRLSGNLNFTTAAGSTLTIRHNGVQWYEMGRAA